MSHELECQFFLHATGIDEVAGQTLFADSPTSRLANVAKIDSICGSRGAVRQSHSELVSGREEPHKLSTPTSPSPYIVC